MSVHANTITRWLRTLSSIALHSTRFKHLQNEHKEVSVDDIQGTHSHTRIYCSQNITPPSLQNEHKEVRVDDIQGAEEAKKVVEESIQM